MTVLDYEGLDPGIRKVVRWLNDNGFKTVDSGDGRSKFGEDGRPLPDWDSGDPEFDLVIPYAHVVIEVAPEALVTESDRLRDRLRERGIDVGEMGPGNEVAINGTYDPCLPEHPAFIMLVGLEDSGLP